MSKFKQGDIIINKHIDPYKIREIKHVYGGEAILNDMITVEFYVFEDSEFSQTREIDAIYILSLKGTLRKL